MANQPPLVHTEQNRTEQNRTVNYLAFLPASADKKATLARWSDPNNHFSAKTGEQAEQIILLCQKLACMPTKSKKPFNAFQFVQSWTNRNAHPAAILETLNALVRSWFKIKSPYGYATKIMRRANGNHHEADAVAASDQFKQAIATDNRILKLIEGIGTCRKP